MARTWYINGRFLTQPVTGVQRYGLEVVSALDDRLAEGHPLGRNLKMVLVAPEGAAPPPHLRQIHFRTAGRLRGHVWEQAVLPRLARGGLLSLCNTGPLSLRKHIVCIHDANTRTCPQSYSRAFRTLYRFLSPALGRSAATIATVSNYSAGQLAKHRICPQEKIVVASNGHEHSLRWIASHSPATREIAGPNTVVIIGSPAPHKNIGLILDGADRLQDAGLRVAVTGIHDRRVLAGQRPERIAGCISWLGRLTDSELAALLRDSLCLAFPSLEEGFGLPVLEAMAMRCPVVASDRASLPEVCGNAALYASPFAEKEWLAAFVRLRDDAHLREQLIVHGQRQARCYSWQRTADVYLNEIARLDGLAFSTAAQSLTH